MNNSLSSLIKYLLNPTRKAHDINVTKPSIHITIISLELSIKYIAINQNITHYIDLITLITLNLLIYISTNSIY